MKLKCFFGVGILQVYGRGRPDDHCQYSGRPTMHCGSQGRLPSVWRVFAGDWKVRRRGNVRAVGVHAGPAAGDPSAATGVTETAA